MTSWRTIEGAGTRWLKKCSTGLREVATPLECFFGLDRNHNAFGTRSRGRYVGAIIISEGNYI